MIDDMIFDNNDNQVKGLVSRLDELETELEGERNNRGKAEKSRCHLVSIFRTPFLRIVYNLIWFLLIFKQSGQSWEEQV